MSGPVGVKPTRSDADIRADLAELARWVNARDEDPTLLLFALATDVEPLLFRARTAEDTATELAVEKADLRSQSRETYQDLQRVRLVLYGTDWSGTDPVAMRDQLRRALQDNQVVLDSYARAEQAEAWVRHLTGETERWVQAVSELEAEVAKTDARLAAVRAVVAHAKNVSPSRSMTVYVTDLEAALEGRT